MFFGSIVAIITPFKQGKIDFQAFDAILYSIAQHKSHGVLVGGTTGEGTLLSFEERESLLTHAVRTLSGRLPLIAGCSAVSTRETINLVDQAERLGCAGALVIPPSYVKPTQEGVIEHFQAIYKHTTLPLVVYNNPARVGLDISVKTLLKLATLPHIVGIKDCNTDLSRVTALRHGLSELRDKEKLPPTKPLSLLCGDSPVFAAHLAMGGDGCFSVTANALPHLSSQLYEAWNAGDLHTFHRVRDQLHHIDHLLDFDTNPIVIKAIMHTLGWCENELRLPLTPLSEEKMELVKRSLSTSLQHAA